MKEPVDHIERPRLPWRASAESLTECGLVATTTRTLSRTDFARRLKEWGERRTMIATCMTCLQTARRWSDWDANPRQALEREIQWEERWGTHDRGNLVRDELRAIALLISRHSEEFRTLLHDVAGTVDFLAAHRKRHRGE